MKKGRLISGIFMIVLSLCLIGSGIFLMLNQNKIKFVSAIRKATSNIVEDMDAFVNVFVPSEFANSKTDSKINTMNSISYADKTITFGGNLYSKYDTQDFYSNLAVNFGTYPINFDLILKETKLYVKLKDLADKYFYTDVDVPEKNTMELTDEQIVTLKDYFIDSTFSALADNTITNTKVVLNLSGVSYNLEKLEVNVSEKDIQEALVIFLKKIEKDKDLSVVFDDLAKNSGTTLKDTIQEAEDMGSDMSTDLLLKYSIYIDNKNVIMRHEVVIPAADDAEGSDVAVSIDSYKDKENRNQFLLTFSNNSTPVLVLEVKGIDESQSVITGSILGVPVISGSYTRTDSNISLVLTVTDSMSGEQPVEYKFNYVFDTITKGKDYKMTLNFNVPGFNVESVNSITLNEAFPEIVLDGAIPFDSMTEEEAGALMNYLSSVLPPEFLMYLQGNPEDMLELQIEGAL